MADRIGTRHAMGGWGLRGRGGFRAWGARMEVPDGMGWDLYGDEMGWVELVWDLYGASRSLRRVYCGRRGRGGGVVWSVVWSVE